MFILELTYTASLDRVDALLEEHVAWLDRGYAEGVFVASGLKHPRDGGVILAVGPRADVEARVAGDPFAVHGVADYRVVEFVPTRTAAALGAYRESLPA